MKAIKKTVSVVLAVMMILCAVTAMSFGASAAETNNTGKITVSSNLSSPIAYNYDENSEQVTVTYYLQADNMIIDVQAYCTYDTSVLKLADTNDNVSCIPVLSSGNAVINLGKPGKILFTSSSLNLFDFKTKGVFFTATFDIIGKGNANIDLNVQVITSTTANSFKELENAEKIQNVFFDKITPSGVKISQSAEVKNPVSEATIYFAAPQGSQSKYTWNNVQLYYGESVTMSKNNFIDMTATGKVATVDAGSLKYVASGEWAVYSVTLTAEQIAAIDSVSRVGFANADNYNIRTDYRYANNVAGNASIAACDGKMFVIDGCASATSEVNSYTGKWTNDTGHNPVVSKTATIYFAAPKGSQSKYTWNNVQLYYGESATMSKNNFIDMTATGKVATVDAGSLKYVVSGEWAVYSVTLTAEQIAAIDSANRVGFANADNYNIRTDFRYANNVAGNASIAAYDEKMFVIDGCASATSEVNSYTGKWAEDTGHDPVVSKTATIYFAAPKGIQSKYTWNDVQLYYGESATMAKNNFIDMTATGKVATVDAGSLKYVVSGDWAVYSVTLTAEQIAAIDSANRVGFANADNYNIRTDFRYANNVAGNASIAAYDGKMFVINGCAGATEVNSYIGSWK